MKTVLPNFGNEHNLTHKRNRNLHIMVHNSIEVINCYLNFASNECPFPCEQKNCWSVEIWCMKLGNQIQLPKSMKKLKCEMCFKTAKARSFSNFLKCLTGVPANHSLFSLSFSLIMYIVSCFCFYILFSTFLHCLPFHNLYRYFCVQHKPTIAQRLSTQKK